MGVPVALPDPLTPASRPLFGLAGLATTGISGDLTLTKTGTTARTVTFPDAAGTVALLGLAQNWTAAQTISTTDVSTLTISQTATNQATASRMLSVSKNFSGAWTSFGQVSFFWANTATAFSSTNEIMVAEYAVRVGHSGGGGSPGNVNIASCMNASIQTANSATVTTGYIFRALSNAAANKWSFYGDAGAGNCFFGDLVGIAVSPTAGNGLLQIASGTTKANGIAFGTDGFLYRASANELRLDQGASQTQFTCISNATQLIVQSLGGATVGQIGTGSNHTLNIITNNSSRIVISNTGQIHMFGGTPVTRSTYGAPTGGAADRTTFDTTTVTLAQLAQRVRALIDDFRARGDFA